MTVEETYRLFYSGQYEKLASYYVDSKKLIEEVRSIAPIVGALTFLGRIREAELLFQRFEVQLRPDEVIMSQFFLGVVTCRHFDFAKARNLFVQNAKLYRKLCGELNSDDLKVARFYVYQGFGFYRYTYGHLKPALKAAEKAYAAAFDSEFLLGRLFSQDLLAHIQINLGKTHIGLRLFKQCEDLATSLERGAMLQIFKVTQSIYRARFGISGASAIEELLSVLAETTHQDGYSRACLLAEMSHQYLLRGEADRAKACLDQACECIYSIDNPRLEILLNFRIAVLLYWQGEYGQALHLVRSAAKRLENSVDKFLELRVRGLEQKILEKLGNHENVSVLTAWLSDRTKHCGHLVSRRIIARRNSHFYSDSLRGQDPLGDLIDDIVKNAPGVVEEILNRGWLGLLYQVYQVDPSSKTLYIGIQGKSLTLFCNGNVRHFAKGATNQVVKFLICLSKGERTKEQIVMEIWQQKYHPLRHDALLYTLVSKLRKELGTNAPWVEPTENGYALQERVTVLLAKLTRSEPEEECMIPTCDSSYLMKVPRIETSYSELNYRQQQILDFLKGSGAIDVSKCSQYFKVSTATANRDLVYLEEKGWVVRSGKGRATRYHYKGEVRA